MDYVGEFFQLLYLYTLSPMRHCNSTVISRPMDCRYLTSILGRVFYCRGGAEESARVGDQCLPSYIRTNHAHVAAVGRA